ncbi:N-acetyl-gamma-glutamyl-phosphate reductase [bacterium]|nr:N-acetyl-gamma-glutamyl-phosphate reductase [bacterium]
MKDSVNIAVAGATGYVGLELIKILSKHPSSKILYLCATKSIGKNIKIFDKSLKKNLPKISDIKNINWEEVNILFTSLPNGEAQKIAKKMPPHVKLIDLSADFRLQNPKIYKKWYGIKHSSKELIKNSIYSIPEFIKDKLKKYSIISCPGCYPTSIQLPLIPLIKEKKINIKNIIVDSKSGYSGGGKNVQSKFKNINIYNSVSAYGVGSHRHVSEINQELSKIAKEKVSITFTPHLIPMFRGILSTIYIELKGTNDALSIYKFLKKYHKNNFFVNISKFNQPIGTGSVINTNRCNISICKSEKKNKVIIISTIDNLIKGASGQAVQNMNFLLNVKETTGLV